MPPHERIARAEWAEALVALFTDGPLLAIFLMVLAWLVTSLAIVFLRPFVEAYVGRPSVGQAGLRLVRAGVVVLVIIALLPLFGANTLTQLVLAGTIGLAIALAIAPLGTAVAKELVFGLTAPFAPGEWIEIAEGEIEGVVESVGIRETRLGDPTGATVVLPHRSLRSTPIVNHGADPRRVEVECFLPGGSGLGETRRRIEASVGEMDPVLAGEVVDDERKPQTYLVSIDADGVRVSLVAWVDPARSSLEVRSRILETVLESVREAEASPGRIAPAEDGR